MPRLVVRQRAQPPREIELGPGRVSIGRGNDNTLALQDSMVSRHHAEIFSADGRFVFRDLGSANGSQVNGQRTTVRALEYGDEIVVGTATLRFVDAAPEPKRPSEDHRIEVRASVRETLHLASIAGEAPHERSNSDLARAATHFQVLDRISRRVLSASSLVELTEVALGLVLDAIEAERGTIQLWRSDRGELERQLTSRRDGRLAADAPVSKTVVDEVVRSGMAVIASSGESDWQFHESASVVAGDIKSVLCVPLWEEDEIHGVIYLDSSASAHRFTEADLELATAIANVIAIRVIQERLNERLAEQRLVRAQLERYHSPDVVKAILSQDSGPSGLEERDVSVMFGDICGFTAIAERSRPADVADLLNTYYDLGTECVFAHGGTVNEYVGDSLMAIFGAPIAQADHARRAVMAARNILERIQLRNAQPRQADGPRFELRIAIHSGPVVVGSVGPTQRMKYAVIGDTVNVAARIEGLANAGDLLIGESTRRALNGAFRTESIGDQHLRNRANPVEVHRVVGLRSTR